MVYYKIIIDDVNDYAVLLKGKTMPTDVITLNAVGKELNKIINDGRIEKVYQPESDEITLTIKAQGKIHNLVISANPSHPRIHITLQKKENALNAPAFCMLLRKYLTGSTVTGVELFNCDRILKITVDARNELKDKVQYYLMVELMGRYSNIILLKSDYVIIDAIRRIHLDQSTTRYILPNLTYPVQSQNKIRLDDSKALGEFFANNSELSVDILMQNISGMSKETAKEALNGNDVFGDITTFFNINESERYCPCIREKDGELKDYYILPYQTSDGEYKKMNSINECLDYYYGIYDHNERKKFNTKNITQLLKRLQNKTVKRIADNKLRITESGKCEELKQRGELILSNIYNIKRGDTQLDCFDYYNSKQIILALDPLLSPSENAQSYFKKYNKLKRAADIAHEQLDRLYRQEEYLKNIEASVENCELKQEFEEIMGELEALDGAKKQQKSSKQKQKPSQPIHFKVEDLDVYIGKNSLQNVQVTFEIGDNGDTWLHTKNYHGCHAIIKGTPNENIILAVAKKVAYYSEGRNSDKVEVDYTLRKFVKKIPSAFIGLVSYTNYKTILVKPSNI